MSLQKLASLKKFGCLARVRARNKRKANGRMCPEKSKPRKTSSSKQSASAPREKKGEVRVAGARRGLAAAAPAGGAEGAAGRGACEAVLPGRAGGRVVTR